MTIGWKDVPSPNVPLAGGIEALPAAPLTSPGDAGSLIMFSSDIDLLIRLVGGIGILALDVRR